MSFLGIHFLWHNVSRYKNNEVNFHYLSVFIKEGIMLFMHTTYLDFECPTIMCTIG